MAFDAEDKKTLRQTERMLDGVGYNAGDVDGELDALSMNALGNFQDAMGMEVTGELDEDTFHALKGVHSRVRRAKKKKTGAATQGQRGGVVRQLEKRLASLGYDVGEVDGVYDEELARAVRRFKRDEDMKSTSGGSAGRNVRQKAGEAIDEYDTDGVTRRKNTETKIGQQWKRRRKVIAKAMEKRGSLQAGQSGKSIVYLKTWLRAAGFDPKSTGKKFTERMKGAVMAFQRAEGLEPTGSMSTRTWRRLNRRVIIAKGPAGGRRQQVGEVSAGVKKTEKLLKKLGIKPGKVDGRYTKATQKAVNRFRKKFKIGGRGKGVDNKLFAKMKKELKKKRRREKRKKNKIVGSAGAPHWGGSDDVLRIYVEPIAARHGLRPNSAKRTETFGNPGSDHHVSSSMASARDFPTANNFGLAAEIRRALDGGSHVEYQNFYFTRGGLRFRGQIIAATHGTGPHLHIGVARA